MDKLAILTAGGDAPGMNAAIRAAVRYGLHEGLEIYGIKRGYAGLLENEFERLTSRGVSDIIQRGGTILRTNRCEEFKEDSKQELAVSFFKKRGIDSLIVIGGDGSLTGAKALSDKGIRVVGIPGTIDNDLGYTDYTLGFDTACNTVLEAINKLRDTFSSHERVCVIEVMGRQCGDIALAAGVGGGAEIILVPEFKIGFEDILSMLEAHRSKGKLSSIIVIAEGAGSGFALADKLTARYGTPVRAVVLGHLQRGGSPSNRDRYLGTSWGVMAVRLLKAGATGRLCGIKDDKLYDIDIAGGLKIKKEFNYDLYNMAGIVSDSFGEC